MVLIFALAFPPPPAKDLIQRLLVGDPSARYSAADVLKHPWVAATSDGKVRDISRALLEMKKFNAKRKFRAGIRVAKVISTLQASAKVRTMRTASRISPLLLPAVVLTHRFLCPFLCTHSSAQNSACFLLPTRLLLACVGLVREQARVQAQEQGLVHRCDR